MFSLCVYHPFLIQVQAALEEKLPGLEAAAAELRAQHAGEDAAVQKVFGLLLLLLPAAVHGFVKGVLLGCLWHHVRCA
jgi:hypothetical protein